MSWASKMSPKMPFGDPRASLPLQERMLKGTTALDTQKENLLLCLKTPFAESCVAVLLPVQCAEGGREGRKGGR